MTTALTTFNAALDLRLKGIVDGVFSSQDRDTQIKAAVRRYSKDRPQIKTVSITGDGGRYYATAGISGWDSEFSQIVALEWDASNTVSSDLDPSYLEPEDYGLYDDAGTQYIFVKYGTVPSTSTIKVSFTAQWVWSGSPETTNTPTRDFDAIVTLASALCFFDMATNEARHKKSSISADSVDYAGQADKWLRLYDKAIKRYEAELGLGQSESKPKPSGGWADWDRMMVDGSDYLFREKRTR